MTLSIKPLSGLEEANQVRELFLDVYGEEYPISLYYEPDNLWRAHQMGSTYCFVALDPNGKVVGHLALYPSTPNPRLLELGAGLVHPQARGFNAMLMLIIGMVDYARQHQLADWLFGEPVCNHIATQKLLARVGFRETAMEVDLMPAATYNKEASAKGRVSTLLYFLQLAERPSPARLYFPRRYEAFIQAGLQTLELEFKEESGALESQLEARAGARTRFTETRNDAADLLRFQVHTIGSDLLTLLEQQAAVFQLILPLTDPAIHVAVDEARSAGFFLGGFLPGWEPADCLLLQRLQAPPDWDSIVLHSEESKQLLALVKSDQSALTTQG